MTRSITAADTRAAQAALTRPLSHQADECDRILVIDDTDDHITEIRTLLRERSPRGLEVLS